MGCCCIGQLLSEVGDEAASLLISVFSRLMEMEQNVEGNIAVFCVQRELAALTGMKLRK